VPLADAAPLEAAPVEAAPPPTPPRWLRGSTHVHAAPSGDATSKPEAVMAWYRAHGYDFIVLTDHNRVTIVDPAFAPSGGRTSAAPAGGPLVIAGTELTYNPGACSEPDPPPKGKCRIHVNGLGVTTRPDGRIEWADRVHRDRRSSYQAALRYLAPTGALVQLNHPQWSWGMTPELLAALAGDGATLVEIANSAFAAWNDGDAGHPSVEALWDRALVGGARLWAVASDDAHSYDVAGGRYPAGGGWIEVEAPRDRDGHDAHGPAMSTPTSATASTSTSTSSSTSDGTVPLDADAIIAAIGAGRFYASTGVALRWAGPVGDELWVEAADDEPGPLTIELIVDGAVVSSTRDRRVTHPLPVAPHYVRARVTRADGARAWTQPASRPSRPTR
jgi:hypothetical protein